MEAAQGGDASRLARTLCFEEKLPPIEVRDALYHFILAAPWAIGAGRPPGPRGVNSITQIELRRQYRWLRRGLLLVNGRPLTTQTEIIDHLKGEFGLGRSTVYRIIGASTDKA